MKYPATVYFPKYVGQGSSVSEKIDILFSESWFCGDGKQAESSVLLERWYQGGSHRAGRSNTYHRRLRREMMRASLIESGSIQTEYVSGLGILSRNAGTPLVSDRRSGQAPLAETRAHHKATRQFVGFNSG